tara:strand:- start:2017 stop:2820 length:804 start_codon:yes stop_codon:yes gene_type:complete
VESNSGLLPALLKYWRNLRGLSQLDLGLAADVSARHISFLETGRAKPSREMLLVLATTLQIPLREQNALLRASGFDPIFEEPSIESLDKTPVGEALDYMLRKHDPYPMVVMDWTYNLIKTNQSADKILQIFVSEPDLVTSPVNVLEMIFNPNLCRPFIVDWEKIAHEMLSRLHRESLAKANDERLKSLLDRLLAFPDVPDKWRQPDFSDSCEATLTLKLQRGEWQFSFLMTMTSFSAPQNITVEELMIESYFPLDKETELACQRLMY